MVIPVGGDPQVEQPRTRRSLRALGLGLVGLVIVLVVRDAWIGANPAAGVARRLRDPVAANRVGAIADLERFGPGTPGLAIPALRAALDDEAAEVRAAAAMALVSVVGAADRAEVGRAMSALFKSRADPDPAVRVASLRAVAMIATLGEHPAEGVDLDRARDVLIGAASDPDDSTRLAGVRGLGGPRLGADPPTVLLAALDDRSAEVRTAAAEGLATFRDGLPRLVPALARSFERARPEARPAYAILFDRVRPGAFGADAVGGLAVVLASPDDDVRRSAASALVGFAEDQAGRAALDGSLDRAIPALVAALARPGREPDASAGPVDRLRLTLAADKTFGWTGEAVEADPALMAARALLASLPDGPGRPHPPLGPTPLATIGRVLTSGRPEVRAAVALALGRFEADPASVPILGEAIRDPDPTVRAAALRGLHDLADRLAFAPPGTVRAALGDASAGVRYWAAGALGHIQLDVGPHVPALLRLAESDPDGDVRAVAAIEVEGFLRPTAVGDEVVPILVAALDRPARSVRVAVAGLLGRLGPAARTAIPRLRDLADHDDPRVGEAARTALARIATLD